MIEQQYLKLMLSHEFYLSNKDRIPLDVFSDTSRELLDVMLWAHTKFARDFTLEEMKLLYFSQNPGLTTSQKNNFSIFVDNLEDVDVTRPDIANYVIAGLWRNYNGARIIALGSKYINGDTDDLSDLIKFADNGTLVQFDNSDIPPVPMDLQSLIELEKNIPRWKFNIPALNNKVPGIAAGELAVVLARPEVGKSQFIIHSVAGPGGFASQGAKVHIIYNEEPARRQVERMYSAHTGMQWQEILDNIPEAEKEFSKIKDNIRATDVVGMTISSLDRYCNLHKPDILIVDQLDRITPTGHYEASHERLAEIYSAARDIAKRHNLALIGVSQASAEAEGVSEVHYSHAEGSKTAKAATADLVIGIGPVASNPAVRILNLSKNKISGNHGAVAVTVTPSLSRYQA